MPTVVPWKWATVPTSSSMTWTGRHLAPTYDVLPNIFYAAAAWDICLNMIDGEVVFRDGVLTRIDEERVKAEARSRCRPDPVRAVIPIQPKARGCFSGLFCCGEQGLQFPLGLGIMGGRGVLRRHPGGKERVRR